MYLKRLEIQGFKSFAEKTILEFPAPEGAGSFPVTAVVGPNGSGKSNIADAIRWVLGEQSMKAVRGKKSEDVIFFGSPERGRAGFAQVSLTLENTDGRLDVPFGEVKISRKLYRNDTSEYTINNQESRLIDIALLLAKAGINAESYAVIAQGMIDHLLLMTPEERKRLFEEATGVRPLEMKKENALRKMKTSEENLSRAELLSGEIEPRLKTLSRQVKKLNEREALAASLRSLQGGYYRTLHNDIEKQRIAQNEKYNALLRELHVKEQERGAIQKSMDALEHKEVVAPQTGFEEEYEKLLSERESIREKEIIFQARSAMPASQSSGMIPPAHLKTELRSLEDLHRTLHEEISKAENLEQVHALLPVLAAASQKTKQLLALFPSDQKQKPQEMPQEIINARRHIEECIAEVRQKMQELRMHSEKDRSHVFQIQRSLQVKQSEIHALEAHAHETNIELAKINTRHETLETEMKAELTGDMLVEVLQGGPKRDSLELQNDAIEIRRLKAQLEWIGGIDPEVMKEHHEAEERFTFLETQVGDLKSTLASLRDLVRELDASIDTQFKQAFEKIQKQFNHYFGILFKGGQAKLTMTQKEFPKAEEGQGDSIAEQEIVEEPTNQEERIAGIDIAAVPAGKRFKNIQMLSGGEKALTSIALLAAILSNNPPPFIVLDEVDAALDEANSERFAKIISELAQFSQFIVITHNRQTMHEADVLYGVTLGEGGVSKLLSLKLEDVPAQATS